MSAPPEPGTCRDVVVVGASAGGVQALRTLVAGLPRDLPATVLVVLHLPEGSPSALAGILDRAGGPPAATAVDGEALALGTVRVARSGHHLQLRDGRLRTWRGPPDHGYRPAVDTLFRSAADDAGPRVVAVVLSGALHDGADGLLAVRAAGGVAVVQDPLDAGYPGMPTSALATAGADHVAPVADLPALLTRLVGPRGRPDVPVRAGEGCTGNQAAGAPPEPPSLTA